MILFYIHLWIRPKFAKVNTAYTCKKIQIAAEIVSSAAPYLAESNNSFINPNSKNIYTNFLGERWEHEHCHITKSEEEERVTQSLSPPLLLLGKSAVTSFQISLEN